MLTYDTSALLGAETGDRAVWVLHETALRRGQPPIVVLAQAWRGNPQAQPSRLLKGCRLDPVTEQHARAAGVGCSASRTADIVDAAVVVTAAARGDTIVTSDPNDLARVADVLTLTVDLRLGVRAHSAKLHLVGLRTSTATRSSGPTERQLHRVCREAASCRDAGRRERTVLRRSTDQ